MAKPELKTKATEVSVADFIAAVSKPSPEKEGLKYFASVAFLIVVAVILRVDAFGDPVANIDDQFYLLVGERMHQGLLPYADVWDRKPPGIFVIYYLIAAISIEPAFYQIVATLFAAATAALVTAIASRWTRRTAATLAGLLYLVMLGNFFGNSGQTAVFYNLPVAAAAWLLTGPVERRRYEMAMLCLGLALTIKQTVAFEAAALGLFAVWRLGPTNRAGNTARFIIVGLIPTSVFSALFLLTGHFAEYWQATFASIFVKSAPDAIDILGRSLDLGRRFIPLVALAALSFGLRSCAFAPFRPFVGLWIAASIIGMVAVPQLYLHYGLPLVLPLCVGAAAALDRRITGPLLIIIAVAGSLIYHRPFQFSAHANSRAEIAGLVQAVDALPGNTLLVFDGPSALYTLTGRRMLSRLAFPSHLNHAGEINVSGLDTNREVSRILASSPAVVVMTTQPRNRPENGQGWKLVRAHVARNCSIAATKITHEMGSQKLLIYDCTRISGIPSFR